MIQNVGNVYNVSVEQRKVTHMYAQRILIIVPVFNGFKYIKKCLQSLLASTIFSSNIKLLIINDCSTDAQLSQWLMNFQQQYDFAQVIFNKSNIGYVKSANIGLKTAADFYVLLNSDTIVSYGWLEELLHAIQARPNIGIVGPLSNNASFENSSHQSLTSTNVDESAVTQAYVNALGFALKRYSAKPIECTYIHGFCMCIKSKTIRAIGLLNEGIKIGYFDENDFCLRAKHHGFVCQVIPTSFVYHFGNKSFQDLYRNYKIYKENKLHFYSLHDATEIDNAFAELRNNETIASLNSLQELKDVQKKLLFPISAESACFQTDIDIHKGLTVAIYAMFNKACTIDDASLYYLAGLKKTVDYIMVIADNYVMPNELRKLNGIACYTYFSRHNMYDFGSYKLGFLKAKELFGLKNISKLIFCNDTCYGPFTEFKHVVDEMDKANADFYGVAANYEFQYHIQSYFWILGKCLQDKAIQQFFEGIQPKSSKQQIINTYEVPFTSLVKKLGYKVGSLIDLKKMQIAKNMKSTYNPTICPIFMLNSKSPIIKKETLLYQSKSVDSKECILNILNQYNISCIIQ